MAKVLFFFTSSYPFGTGETFIENEIEYLSAAFEKVVIVSNNTENEQTRDVPKNVILLRKGYELTKLHKLLAIRTLFSPEFWKELKTIRTIYKRPLNKLILNTILQSWHKAKTWQPFIQTLINTHTQPTDQLFLYSYWNNDIALALALYGKKHNNCKAITRMHGWDVYFEANESNYLPFRKYVFQNLNQVFAISDKGKDYYKKWLPELNHKISVARLGVKQRGANPGNSTNTLRILSVSNMIPIKNLDTLIDALALIKIDCHWTHIGDGHLRALLEKQAEDKIPGKYTFKGRIPNYEVLAYLENKPVDLFINVSLSEGIPVSIMEAISFGVPCIATTVGGTPEIVDEHNGFLLPDKPTLDDIKVAIEHFYHLPEQKQIDKRKTAIETWKEKYNAKKNYQSFIDKILAFNKPNKQSTPSLFK